jgi:cellulose synthase/poly-beta-1,6-N-acetylglucosamine synthase-like glycosyltransferase
MKLLVSIIIPCYNSELWIANSIESCLKQTYSHIEIIVIINQNLVELLWKFGFVITKSLLSDYGCNHIAKFSPVEFSGGE